MDNKHITDRPKELFATPFYKKLPEEGFVFNYDSLPQFLNMDMYTMLASCQRQWI